MATYTFTRPSGMTLSQFYDLIEPLAIGAGITLDSGTFSINEAGELQFTQTPDLTGPQVTAIQNALNNWVYVDYPALTQAAKVNAKDVLSDIEEVYTFALTRWSGLSGAQKLAVLTTLTTGWGGASAAQKADALRDLLSLVVVAIYFIYLKFISNGA